MNASEIIDLLGGTSKVAELCEVEPPSVSEWRKNGIPPARLMYLKVIRPDVFAAAPTQDKAAACAHPSDRRTAIRRFGSRRDQDLPAAELSAEQFDLGI